MRRAIPVALLAVLAVAGCGDSGPTGKRAERARRPAHSSAPPAPVRSGDARVIRRWAETLRAGDVAGAARLFAVPVVVENGSPPKRLESAAQVRAFNASLPCGARLIRTQRRDRYTVATFRLTDRPGGACGSGVGGTAATAFRLRRGRIVEWLRVPVGPIAPPVPEQRTLPPDASTS